MSVHYKFKSALDFDTVSFDGLNISVGDLKRAIIHQKRLGKATDFDLHITNAQTKEEYQDDSTLIPKNTSLIIARIPITHQQRKIWNPQNPEKSLQPRVPARVDGSSLDLSKMKGSEEEKILEMMIQSTADYDPKSYHRLRGHSQTGDVPPTYRCNKCKKGGHWIKNCPFSVGKDHMEVKRNTGIPRSFLDKEDKDPPSDFVEPILAIESKKEIPEDLICSICKDLFVDAVMIPCCGSSFCDDCVRTALLESEDNECPDCKEKGSSPGSLIPNRFLRNSVNAFKNENGYNTSHNKKVSEDKVTELQDDNSKPKSNESSNSSSEKDTKEQGSNSVKEEQVKVEADKEIDEKHLVKTTGKVSPCNSADKSKAEDIESDYEDNITIKMPPAQVKSPCRSHREQLYTGRNTSHPRPPGIESSPHHSLQASPLHHSQRIPTKQTSLQPKNNEWDHEYNLDAEYAEETDNSSYYKINSLKQYGPQQNAMSHYAPNKGPPMRLSRPAHLLDVYAGPSNRGNTFQQMPSHPMPHEAPAPGPNILPYNNSYNQPGQRQSAGYQRPIFHNMPAYPMERCPVPKPHQLPTSGDLASVYQGVAAKVGTGIIEDPLETFNRLMREKERRREERRRQTDYRRSRSNERQQRSRYHGSPYRRTSREIKEKPRIRDFERKHNNGLVERSRFSRHRRSISFSDRSSRSRSRSNSSHKKRSKSPYTRRSRSRPYNTNDKNRDFLKHQDTRGEEHTRKTSPIPTTSISQDKSYTHYNAADWYAHRTSSQIPSEHRYKNVKKERLPENSDTLEPPPPGFEWYQSNVSCFIDDNKTSKRNTPDVKEHRTYEMSDRLERSPSKSDSRTTNRKKRYNRSRSPSHKNPLCTMERTYNKKPRLDSEAKKTVDRKRETDHGEKESMDKHTRITGDSSMHKSDKKVIDKNKALKLGRQLSPQHSLKSDKLDSKLIVVDKEKQNVNDILKSSSKKLKERKKKRKDKVERKDRLDRKKLKRDKKGKREKDQQKSEEERTENKSLNENELSRTPDINAYAECPVISKDQNDSKTEAAFMESGKESIIKTGDNNEAQTKSDDKVQAAFKRFDSVLDIHGYETDFDEMNTSMNIQAKQKDKVSLPELSKWEREDQNTIAVETIKSMRGGNTPEKSIETVTDDVLRKAENAIFTRAIKAVNTNFEDNKGEQQKNSESLQKISQNDSKEMKNFEITVPTRNSQERSVQIRRDVRKRSHSPRVSKSVKERLGSKIFSKQDQQPLHKGLATKPAVNRRDVDHISKRRDRSYERSSYRDDREKKKYNDSDRDVDYKSSKLYSRDAEANKRNERQKYEDSPKFDLISKHHNKNKIRFAEKGSKRLGDKHVLSANAEKGKHSSNENEKVNPPDITAIQNKNDENSRTDFSERESKSKLHIKDTYSATDSSSSSGTESFKRKKKHKYKKDKKRSKHSLSSDSGGSSKEKHIKNKKRSKSSKRKKKNKK